jgi:hypothetical protein
MGNLCPAQQHALAVFIHDVQDLFKELTCDQTDVTAIAINAASTILQNTPCVGQQRLIENWYEVTMQDTTETTIEQMLSSSYLDVPGIVKGKQMLELYTKQPAPQQAVIKTAFDKTIASCCAFKAIPSPEPN